MATIEICKIDAFRNDLAIAIVEEAHPGYHGGYHYADPIKGNIYYKEKNALWNPWPSEAFVIPVRRLAAPYNYSDQVDWNLVDLPWEEMIGAYIEEYEPISIDKSEVINFARNYSEKWEKLISLEEKIATEEAISFAKSEILDEIEVDDSGFYL